MNRTFRFGVMLASLVFCFGCDSGPPPSTEAETKAMNESARIREADDGRDVWYGYDANQRVACAAKQNVVTPWFLEALIELDHKSMTGRSENHELARPYSVGSQSMQSIVARISARSLAFTSCIVLLGSAISLAEVPDWKSASPRRRSAPPSPSFPRADQRVTEAS